jgi:NAD-dependent protein deacetylase/lipoamidase
MTDELIVRAARDLIHSRYAIALTGAGMSTESGIPDFRGPSGIWTKNPEAERQAYEAYDDLLRDPKRYWEEILTPGSFFNLFEQIERALPNPGHYALAELERMGILKLVITQNVDGLHQKAGSQNVIEYHGGLLKLRCMSCGSRFKREEFDFETLKKEDQLPPRCKNCNGILKHDGVYFREPIPRDVYHQSLEAASKCDVMLICGTSAVVYPFAELPLVARQRRTEKEGTRETDPTVTMFEVNAEPTPLTEEGISDYLIQGQTGEVIPAIVEQVIRIRE